MKKWIPIIVAGLIVLALRLPNSVLKKDLSRQVTDLVESGRLNGLAESGSPGVPQTSAKIGNRPGNHNLLVGDPYIDREMGFSIRFPVDWTVRQAISGDDILIKATYRADNHKFAAINISAWQLDGSHDVARMTPTQLYEMTYRDTADLLDSGITGVGGHNTLWLELKLTKGPFPGNALSYVLVRGNVLFQLYGITVMGDESWFAENKPKFLASFATFRFLK